jgi:aminoglycoside 6'-N-acetyltransferase I
MTIIPLTKTDIDKCADLYIKSYNRAPWNYAFTKEKAVQYLTEYTERSRFVGFVLIEDEQIMGAMFGHSKTWWTDDLLYIDELFISPDSQRMGYGRRLINHCQRYAKQQGYEVVTLMTNKHMPAINFYKDLDYLEAEQFVFLFKPM